MTRVRMTLLAVIALNVMACGRPPAELSLTLVQTAWPGRKSVEVVVQAQKLEVTARIRDQVIDRRAVAITAEQSSELRHLFWRAWRNQPEPRRVPHVMDGVLIEQVWEGPERSWRVSTRGPLTKRESDAFSYLNPLLPALYRFPLKLGFDSNGP
jgi:hypothetical protein